MAVASVESPLKESLKIIRKELSAGMRSDMSAEDMYSHTKSKGKEHQKLTFEGEDSKSYHWNKTNDPNHFNAKLKLKENLPECVCNQITSSEFSDITRIMNESAGVEGLTTFFSNSKSDHTRLTEFSVIEHIHSDHSQVKIHYVKITARANCSRFLMSSNDHMELKADYKVSTFTVKNEDLLKIYSSNHQSLLEQALNYLARNDVLKALRF